MKTYSTEDANTIADFILQLSQQHHVGLMCGGFRSFIFNCKCPMMLIAEYIFGPKASGDDVIYVVGNKFHSSFIDGFDGVTTREIHDVEAYSLGNQVYDILKEFIVYIPNYSPRA